MGKNPITITTEAKTALADLNTLLGSTNDLILKIHENARSLGKDFFKVSGPKQANEALAKRQKNEKKLTLLLKEKRRIINNLVKAQTGLQVANSNNAKALADVKVKLQEANKKTREAAILSNTLANGYASQSIRLNNLRKRYKDVALTQGTASKQALRLAKRIKVLDDRLKRVDANVGQFQRSIGNYGKAMNRAGRAARNLAGAMGLLGGAFLIIRVIRDAFNKIRTFDKSMQNLAGILGVNRKELGELEKEIIKVASASIKTSTEVASLAETLIVLGKTKEEVIGLLKPVNELSIGLQATSQEAGELLIQTLNAFGQGTEEAQRYADIIAKMRTSTALDFTRIKDALGFLAPTAKAAGVSLEKTGAILGVLVDRGIKASRAGRLISSSFLRLAKNGLTLEDALDGINKAQRQGANETKLLAVALDFFGLRSGALGLVLADNRDKIAELTEEFENSKGTLDTLINEQLKSLDAHLLILKSRWEEWILNTNEANQSSNKLKTGIKFLSDNLNKILSTLITVTKVWIAYKIAVLLASVQTKIATIRFGETAAAASLAKTGVVGLTISWKSFTKALHANILGIVFLALFALWELSKKFNITLSETAKKLQEQNKEFLEQVETTNTLNTELETMADRYEILTGKAELSKDEQIELDDIIKLIAKHVPDAVTEIDKYGDATVIATGKVAEFVRINKELAKLDAGDFLAEQEILLKSLNIETGILSGETSKLGVRVVAGVGTFKQYGAQLHFVATRMTAAGFSVEKLSELTEEQRRMVKRATLENEASIITTEGQIKRNKALLGIGEKVVEGIEGQIVATGGETEAIIRNVKFLREQIALRKLDLEKTSTKAEADPILAKIAGLKLELEAILGNAKAGRKIKDVAKEDAFNLAKEEIEISIEKNEAILDNELETNGRKISAGFTVFLEKSRLLLLERDRAIFLAGDRTDELTRIEKRYNADLKILETERGENTNEHVEKSIKDSIDASKRRFAESKRLSDEQVSEELIALREKLQVDLREAGVNKDEIERIEREHAEAVTEIKRKAAKEEIRIQIAVIEAQLANTDLSPETRLALEQSLSIAKMALSKIETDARLDDIDRQIDGEARLLAIRTKAITEASNKIASALNLDAGNLDRFITGLMDGFGPGLQGTLNAIGASAAIVGDIFNSIFEANITQLDEQIQANDDFYAEILATETITLEQRAALEAERDLKNAILEKKKRKEVQKQAINQKIFGIVEVGINTAIAVTKVLAQTGVIAPLLIPGIIALGVASAAAIAAAPIPKFRQGRTGGEATLAYVGEGGVSEILEKPNRDIRISPPKKTLTYLTKGEKVHSSAEEYLKSVSDSELNQNIYRHIAISNMINQTQRIEQNSAKNDNSDIVKAIRENRTQIKIINETNLKDAMEYLLSGKDIL